MQSIRDVDLNLLVLLDALLQERSVTGAATRLSMSAPAASRALGRLRVLLGDPLLVRAGRSMVPSPRAEALTPEIRRLVEEVGRVLQPRPTLEPSHLVATYRIRATDHVLAVLGGSLDARAREEAPGVDLAFSPCLPSDPQDLRDDRVGLAIGVYHQAPPELLRTTLFRDRFVCVMRRGNPSAPERELSIERFAALSHVLVAPRFQPGSVVDRALEVAGLKRRVVRAVPYFLAALHLVAESDYVLTVSERLARAEADRFGLCIFEPPVPLRSYPIHMLWHPRTDSDAGHRWLRQTIIAAAATLDAQDSVGSIT